MARLYCASMASTPEQLVERFWSRVDKDGPIVRPGLDECWLWTGTRGGRDGYGRYSLGKNKSVLAHRFALASSGVNIVGVEVCHHCDNRRCVRPSHLFPGTKIDNMKDASRKGRLRGNPRFDPEDIEDMRELRAMGIRVVEIAQAFETVPSTVYSIVSGVRWGRFERPNADFEARRDTHCRNGHPRSAYLYVRPSDGRRRCRECLRVQKQAHDRRRHAGS